MEECEKKYYIKNDSILLKQEFCIDAEKIQRGKCVYEVIRIIDGIPLFFESHINRMKNSASLISKDIPYDDKAIINKIFDICKSNNVLNGNIKIVINYESNDFLIYFLKHYYPNENEYEYGVDTIIYHGERSNPNAKIINSGFREDVDKLIKEKNAFEAILVDNNGYITEGSKSNMFFVKANTVYTSPVKNVLPGVTRKYVIDICNINNINIKEVQIKEADLDTFDAVFISGTSPKILPVKIVEKYNYNSSKNETVLKIIKNYDKVISEYLNEFKNKYMQKIN